MDNGTDSHSPAFSVPCTQRVLKRCLSYFESCQSFECGGFREVKVWRAEMGKGETVEGWGQYGRTNPGGQYVARHEIKEWLPSASRRNSLAARKEAGWRRVRMEARRFSSSWLRAVFHPYLVSSVTSWVFVSFGPCTEENLQLMFSVCR